VIISLVPRTGVPPLLFGMTVDEALAAMSTWGTPESIGVRGETELRVHDEGLTRDVFAYFDAGVTVNAVELWCPKGTETSVVFDGIDLFQTDADEILVELVQREHRVDRSDPVHPILPEVTLGFTRENLGPQFEAVVIARPGYYD
jgi:hypothetical protein